MRVSSARAGIAAKHRLSDSKPANSRSVTGAIYFDLIKRYSPLAIKNTPTVVPMSWLCPKCGEAPIPMPSANSDSIRTAMPIMSATAPRIVLSIFHPLKMPVLLILAGVTDIGDGDNDIRELCRSNSVVVQVRYFLSLSLLESKAWRTRS